MRSSPASETRSNRLGWAQTAVTIRGPPPKATLWPSAPPGPASAEAHLAVAGRLTIEIDRALDHDQQAGLFVTLGLGPAPGAQPRQLTFRQQRVGQPRPIGREPAGGVEDLEGQATVVGHAKTVTLVTILRERRS